MRRMLNEKCAAQTSEEIRKTSDMERSRGVCIGAFAPYGYQKDPENKNKLIVDEEVAPVVQDIFRWFLYGTGENNASGSLSIAGIARELNERKIPSPIAYKKLKGFNYKSQFDKFSQNVWCSRTISNMLKNRMYIGCMVQGKYRVISYKIHKTIITPEDEWFVVEGTHEPIISTEMFDEVQKRLLRDTRTPPSAKEIHIFAGLLRCADCGRAMHRKSSGNSVYYYCRTVQESRVCAPRSIREDVLHKTVLQAIQTQVALICNMEKVISEIGNSKAIAGQSNALSAQLKQRQIELERIASVTDDLYIDWKAGDLTRDEYLRMKGRSAKQVNQLNEAIQKLESELNRLQSNATSETSYFACFKKHQVISELRRDTLIDLVDYITIHQDKTVEIQFNHKDQYQRILDYIEGSKRALGEPVSA